MAQPCIQQSLTNRKNRLNNPFNHKLGEHGQDYRPEPASLLVLERTKDLFN